MENLFKIYGIKVTRSSEDMTYKFISYKNKKDPKKCKWTTLYLPSYRVEHNGEIFYIHKDWQGSWKLFWIDDASLERDMNEFDDFIASYVIKYKHLALRSLPKYLLTRFVADLDNWIFVIGFLLAFVMVSFLFR